MYNPMGIWLTYLISSRRAVDSRPDLQPPDPTEHLTTILRLSATFAMSATFILYLWILSSFICVVHMSHVRLACVLCVLCCVYGPNAWNKTDDDDDDYLTICQSYDRLTTNVSFTKHLTKDAKLFSATIRLQNRKIVWDSVRKLAYSIYSQENS